MERITLSESLGGLVTAFRTLTLLPIPGRDAQRMSSALPWFPLVGAIVGAIAFAGAWILQFFARGNWALGGAAFVVAAAAFLTRGLHLDGLADMVDGLGGATDRKRALEIMKDSHIGAFGVIAVVLLLLLKFVALARILESCSPLWIIVAALLSRTIIVELAVRLPYARTEGGTGGAFVAGATNTHRVIAWSIATLGSIALIGLAGLVAVALALGTVLLLARWYHRRVGGVTGDLLGASCEIVDSVLLFCGALIGTSALLRLPIQGL